MGGAGDSTGGAVATGGVVASGGVVAAGGSSIDAATSDVSATGGPISDDASEVSDGLISGDWDAVGIGGSYVGCVYTGGSSYVWVLKEADGVCVLLGIETPVSGTNNLGLNLPGRWGVTATAAWPVSIHTCTGSLGPSGSVHAISGSGTVNVVLQATFIVDLDIVLQFPSGDAEPVSYPMKVTGLQTQRNCPS